MDNIIVEIINDTVYCHKKDNTYTNNIIGQHTGIILDLCDIISDYFNCIVSPIKILLNHYCMNYNTYIKKQYIDFKLIKHNLTLRRYTFSNDWCYINEDNRSTIIHDTDYNFVCKLLIYTMYMQIRYNINNYFDKHEIPNKYRFYKNQVPIYKNDVFEYDGTRKITILDHDLLLYLILIMKKIMETYDHVRV